ncbi:putative type VI secretion system effector [Burkholderia sp. Ax-1719]|uniref:putative type VI secretion system effector n=1 Tax=Burkholderia sp. Ax-1719 TaxID=2608334 RepID=UPI001420FAD2|nr:putative type VI secretion system effector [Burkholderia sp. Ax-1719]
MELIKGTISHLKTQRRRQDFVMSPAQHGYMETTAAGAALMGMGSQAMGLVNISGNSEEEADWVEFELDGKPMRGWVWKMPMSDGDQVEVVAESAGQGRYVVYSIRRPEDSVVATFPHANCGTKALYRRVMKMMIFLFLGIYLILGVIFLHGLSGDDFTEQLHILAIGGSLAFLIFFGLFYISYRKLRGFSLLAEEIFKCYGWSNVEKINLGKSSRKHRPENTLERYGLYYFRYNPAEER